MSGLTVVVVAISFIDEGSGSVLLYMNKSDQTALVALSKLGDIGIFSLR